MKKIITTLVFFLIISTTNAQAFEAKNFNLDIGYALGSHRSAFYSPGVLVNLEKGVHKWIGVGAYFGYQYNIGGGYGLGWAGGLGRGWAGGFSNAHSIPIGVSGSFHFFQMIADLTGEDIMQDKIDIAFKPSFGVRFDINDRFNARFDFGTSFMFRYFISEKVGFYAEVGYPAMGNALIGAAFKF